MKRFALLVSGVLAVSASTFAQSSSDYIDRATAAAPANMRDAATVIKWNTDGTYETLRKGTNKLVCYDRAGLPGHAQAFAVQCTSLTNLPRVAQNLKFEAIADPAAKQKAMDAAEADGTRVKPEYGSVWFTMTGTSKDTARMHVTIAVPGATTKSTGLPDSPANGGVWIMNAGTTTAHLMTPGH